VFAADEKTLFLINQSFNNKMTEWPLTMLCEHCNR